MQKILVTLFLSLLFFSCSEQVYEYEEKIREELKATNQTMSEIEIKKTAIYLSGWTEPSFYQGAIDDFKKNDTLKFPPKDSILFIGSSSIVYWKTLKEDMSPHEVINRGFGGAHIAHINNHFNEVVTAYKPKGIVFFCGTNDLTAFKSVNQVFNVAYGERISLNTLWKSLKETSGKEITATYGPPRKGDVRDSLANIEKAKKLMGYDPKFSVQEGMKITWNYFIAPA